MPKSDAKEKEQANEDVVGYEHAFDVWWESLLDGQKSCKAKLRNTADSTLGAHAKIEQMATAWESYIDLMWYFLKKGRQSARRMARTRGVDNIRTYTKKPVAITEQVNKALEE